MKVYIQKQMISVKYRHFFYKISFPIYVFLPALQNLKDISCGTGPFQLLATSFTRLPGLPRQSRSDDLSADL
jgi:hypothetical protein